MSEKIGSRSRLGFRNNPVVSVPEIDSPGSVQSDVTDIGFDEDPLNYTPTRPNGTIISKHADEESSRSKKMRSISPHSRLLRRRRSDKENADGLENEQPTIVTVTSCRSDAYYHQKAPGSASKLPQKAPSALKLFHELATGVKDAYEAVGSTPIRPEMDEYGKPNQTANEIVLWEFMSNLDFVSICCNGKGVQSILFYV